MQKNALLVFIGLALSTTGCSSKSSTPAVAFSSDKPSVVMGALATGVAKVGAGLSGSVSLASVSKGGVKAELSTSDCSVHGEPASVTNRADAHYSGLLTYCKITTDTGDEESVPGLFSGIQDIACMVENAAPTYDGAAHSVTLTFDSHCFTASKLANMGVAAGTTVTATVTASAPAAFNTHFDKGVDITVNVGGNHHYTFGTKVTGNIIEVTYFDEDLDQAHKTGSGAGYLDLTSGILRVESRMDRILCSQASSCGWNRHIRLYSTLTMDGLTPKQPKEIQFLYSNVSSAALGGQSSYDGLLVTASGDLSTTGVKPRGFTTGTQASDAAVNTIGNWTENPTSTDCFTYSSQTAGTCGAGLGKMSTNLKYVMSVGSSYTLPTSWFTTEPGLTFTSVSADSDLP
jgi:hypothetical protein